jgi:RNA polymerase sigma-70 factor (ECF subfamily)
MDEITRQAMDVFFRGSEQRAYLMAMTLTRNHHDALELVQESMLKLVQNYCDRKQEEWAPLFYRILHNGIKDWYRKQKVRQVLRELMLLRTDDETIEAPACEQSAEHKALIDDELTRVLQALQQLPLRQQQTFLLRAWQEMSTREAAFALSISENSVKTHYARAIQKLRQLLGDENE